MNKKLTRLGDLCEVITKGTTPTSMGFEFVGKGIGFLRVQNIDGGTVNYKHDTFFIDEKTHQAFSRSQIYPGDVLVSIAGTIGRVGVVPENAPRLNCNQAVAIIRTKGEIFRPFLRHWFESADAKKQMRSATVTGTISNLSLSQIGNLQIHLPPLDEQRRIAAILDKADAIRRKRQESMRLTEEFLRSIFLDMFGDPVTNPKGWDKGPIKELGNVTTGNTPSRECSEYYGEGIEWIKSDNINTPFHFLTEAKEYLTPAGQKIGRVIPENSTLVTCIAGSPECIGNAALTNRPVAFNQQINSVTPFTGTDPYFLYVHILAAKKLIQGQSTESMKGMVSKGKFENIPFLKPPANLQADFGKIFTHFHSMIQKTDSSNQLSSNLFNALTHRVFRGEL